MAPSRPLAAPLWPRLGPVRPPLRPRCGPLLPLCGPVAATCGPVVVTCGPVAVTCGHPAATCGPVATTCGPVAANCGHAAATCGPVAVTCGPPPSDRAAEQPNSPAAHLPSSRAALQPSRPAAEPPTCRAAEPPSSRAAQQPSRRAAEPPTSRAAEPPSSRAAQPPSRPTVDPLLFLLVDDRQLFLQCDRADGLSLFDLTSGASPAPPATGDSTVRSQWATRDAAARLAVRRHLPTTERAHFSQYKSDQTLYDAVVARYSSPATAALSRLMLLYLFPDLAAFPTVADLITHLRTSDTRYRAALRAEDHFLSVCPTTLIVELLEKSLLAAEKSIVAVGASHGDPRTPVFEGCSPSPLLPSVASAAAADLVGFESVGAASAPSGRRRTGKGKGGKGAGGAGGGGGGGGGGSGGGGGGGGSGGGGGGGGSSSGGGGGGGGGVGSGGGGGGGGGGDGGGGGAAAVAVVDRVATLRRGVGQRGGGAGPCTYVLRTGDRAGAGETAALGASASAAPSASASAAPGAGESALSGTTSAQALHTFTLDSGVSRSFFQDRTTLTPLSRPVAVSPADPSGGPVLASFSTVLPCPTAPSGTLSGLYLPSFSRNLVSGADQQDRGVDQFTPTSQQVTHCTCAQTGRHLATFTCRPGSSLYTLTTESPPATDVKGRQRSAPHSSEFPPTEASLQTLHMDVWGPTRVRGQGHERYFLLVVDDYSGYTTVFPLRSKGDVTETFTLPASPQQNGIAERRIGMVMDVARTSMIHAAAPHFLWPFAVLYAAHQLNLQPRGSRAFVRDLSADKLSPRAAPCVFLAFPPDAPGWQFYHPTSHRVLSSQDVTFDESVPYYRLFPYRAAPLPPPPLFLTRSSLFEVAVESGAARGAEPAGAGSGGAEPAGAESRGAEPGGAETGGVESGGAESGGAEFGGAEPGGAGSARVAADGASSRREPLSPQELREWFARRWSRAAGAGGTTVAAGSGGARTGGTRAAGTRGAAGAAGVGLAGAAGGAGAAGPTGVGTTRAAGAGASGGVGAGVSAGARESEGAGGDAVGAGVELALVLLLGVLLRSQLQPASPLPPPSPYTGPTGGLAERQSSLPVLPNPKSDSLRAASPTVTRLLATAVTDPSFESTAASA
ncbi:unnamed protein product [Closterium sp. NIES-64]|nr:unnamed protein product [Closterium sp. NIES-64]